MSKEKTLKDELSELGMDTLMELKSFKQKVPESYFDTFYDNVKVHSEPNNMVRLLKIRSVFNWKIAAAVVLMLVGSWVFLNRSDSANDGDQLALLAVDFLEYNLDAYTQEELIDLHTELSMFDQTNSTTEDLTEEEINKILLDLNPEELENLF